MHFLMVPNLSVEGYPLYSHVSDLLFTLNTLSLPSMALQEVKHGLGIKS